MNEANKEGRARAALKKALSELENKDTFNVIMFDAAVRPFSSDLAKPTSDRIAAVGRFMEDQETHFGTNMGAALKTALSMRGVTHVYLITDGEPTEGIKDGAKLRRYVIEHNESGAQIVSIALATGPRTKGLELLRGLAEDSGGSLHVVRIRSK
jgi:Mg-chelatase subunit ChlD